MPLRPHAIVAVGLDLVTMYSPQSDTPSRTFLCGFRLPSVAFSLPTYGDSFSHETYIAHSDLQRGRMYCRLMFWLHEVLS
jgi:hypothetical protein